MDPHTALWIVDLDDSSKAVEFRRCGEASAHDVDAAIRSNNNACLGDEDPWRAAGHRQQTGNFGVRSKVVDQVTVVAIG